MFDLVGKILYKIFIFLVEDIPGIFIKALQPISKLFDSLISFNYIKLLEFFNSFFSDFVDVIISIFDFIKNLLGG